MYNTAGKLLSEIQKSDREKWKDPRMYDICLLAVEYLTLDGLPDACRESDIRYALADGDEYDRRKYASI